MPQMMPSLWTLIIFYSIMTLMLIISVMYFFYLPNMSYDHKMPQNLISPLSKWNWKW